MIRDAKPSDYLPCLDLARASLPAEDRVSGRWFLRQLAMPGTRVLVYSRGGGVVGGFLMLRLLPSGVTLGRLLVVAPWCRRLGVARELLKHVPSPAVATVRVENQASRAMVEGAGWKVVVEKGGWVRYRLGY